MAALSAYPVNFALEAHLFFSAMAVSKVGSKRSPTVFSRIGWKVGWAVEMADCGFSTNLQIATQRNYPVKSGTWTQRLSTFPSSIPSLLASDILRNKSTWKHRQWSSRESPRERFCVIFLNRKGRCWYWTKWCCGWYGWRLAYITCWSRDQFRMNRPRRRSLRNNRRGVGVVFGFSMLGVHCSSILLREVSKNKSWTWPRAGSPEPNGHAASSHYISWSEAHTSTSRLGLSRSIKMLSKGRWLLTC